MKIRNKDDFKDSFLKVCLGKNYLRRVKDLRLFLKTNDFKNEFLHVKDNSKILLECLDEVKPLLSQVRVGTWSNGGEYPTDIYDYCITSRCDIVEICDIVNKHLQIVNYGYKIPLTIDDVINEMKG